MAKGNTWYKKLETKRKAFEMKHAKGNQKGIVSHCMRARTPTARPLGLLSINDTDPPGKPIVEKKSPLPMRAGWKDAIKKPYGVTRWGNKFYN